ncbi:MAG: DEAD/DEAH box helicase, partial [Syntrophaceae bacterium]|nr:DEAD/DEAH box helicase [Syntrophaceae bacterium]
MKEKKRFDSRNPFYTPKFPKPDRKSLMKPEIASSLKDILAKIGKPHPSTFTPDEFQTQALEAIRQNDCLVIAPTGSGKTWIAREAILSVMEQGGRAWYASPLKAL